MDIFASDGKFIVTMAMLRVETKWNKDETLSVRATEPTVISITTNRGDYIEVLNDADAVVAEGGDGGWFHLPVGADKLRLRFKALPDPNLTADCLANERQTVTRYLLSDAPSSLDIPDTLAGAIEWMQGQLAAIPEASRDTARFRFDTTMDHGETYPNIEISYSEPESDGEVIRRVQVSRERERVWQAFEREQLQNLQAKYAND